MEGVLKSWAVPKGPPTEPHIKRLAMQVEDHPIGYGSFQGTIGKGEYGAGKVEIWDNGTYDLLEQAPRKLRFTLHGKKLQGEYELILFKEEGERKLWLIFKKPEAADSTRSKNLRKKMGE